MSVPYTGSGYGAALAARRLSDERVTSVDVDPYLTEAVRKRVGEAGVAPMLDTIDATGDLPYEPASFDRIVATVSVGTIPAGRLRVLRLGGRLVTTIAGTSLLVTAEKDQDGGATGRVEWARATATGNERPTVRQGGPAGHGTRSTRSATTGSATASYRCEGPGRTSHPMVVRSSAAESGLPN
ncbi:methyltransferase domain-containing protein [Streptomyces sp. NPDC003442]